MPTRRTLLALAGSSASLALAGCSALEDDSDSENGNNSDPNPETESPSAGDPVDTGPPIAGASARKAATNYDVGHGEFQTALETFRDASDKYDRGEYAICVIQMGEAERTFNSARDSFAQALAELAGTEAPEDAVEACNTARQAAADGWSASDTFKLAGRVAQQGEIGVADDRANAARSTLSESETVESPFLVRSLLNVN